MRVLVMLALCFGLSACFSSERPLYSEDRGRCPFATATTLEEIGETAERYVFITSGGYCQATNTRGRVSRTLFVPIGDEWWIVQDDDEHPAYGLVHRDGARLDEYLPKCSDFSAERLRRLGVTFTDGQQECTATDAGQIDTLFRAWRSHTREPDGAFRVIE